LLTIPAPKKEPTMAIHGRVAALALVGIVVALPAPTSQAESFYAGGLPVIACPDNAFYENGSCRRYDTGAIVPPTLFDAWVATNVLGAVATLQTQNEKLQKQVDELTARVRALEAKR
jgi:hypothetical protein